MHRSLGRKLTGQFRMRRKGLSRRPHTRGAQIRRISLTPCFSWVGRCRDLENRFNGLPHLVETVETVPVGLDLRNPAKAGC